MNPLYNSPLGDTDIQIMNCRPEDVMSFGTEKESRPKHRGDPIPWGGLRLLLTEGTVELSLER